MSLLKEASRLKMLDEAIEHGNVMGPKIHTELISEDEGFENIRISLTFKLNDKSKGRGISDYYTEAIGKFVHLYSKDRMRMAKSVAESFIENIS